MNVQQKRLAVVVDSPGPHRPRLRKRVAIPLATKPEREERVIDGGEVGIVAIGNDEIEIPLAGATGHEATTDVLDHRIWQTLGDQCRNARRGLRRSEIPRPQCRMWRRVWEGTDRRLVHGGDYRMAV